MSPGHQRDRLSFRAVNRRHSYAFNPGLQRHHLLPCQLLSCRSLARMFDNLGKQHLDFDDFRMNGLLLPSSDAEAVRIGLPLHRGPHRRYNALVVARVSQVEAGWAARRLKAPDAALDEAVMRLRLLQRSLRRSLLDTVRRRFTLNCHDSLGTSADFSELDAMADALWGETRNLAVAMPI